jgi:hypothetical protein
LFIQNSHTPRMRMRPAGSQRPLHVQGVAGHPG